jgi:hypothetical protein
MGNGGMMMKYDISMNRLLGKIIIKNGTRTRCLVLELEEDKQPGFV